MRFLVPMLIAALASSGCDKMPSEYSEGGAPAADNTAVNQRDQDGATKTPTDQGENDADVKRTAEIRQGITDAPGLSVNARNVKIITAGGKVTLRGPVASQAEKESIEKIAQDAAGAENVDSQLEIAP